MRPVYVVVSGPPGSGKTTLSRQLSLELGLPLLAKDTVKESLMTVLDVPDVTASRRIGAAAVAVLLAVAPEVGSAVLESVWHRSRAQADLRALDGRVVEVFCRCDRALLEARYRVRASTRAPGHFDTLRVPVELWGEETAEPVAGGWPVLEVPTAGPVPVTELAAAVWAAAGGPGRTAGSAAPTVRWA